MTNNQHQLFFERLTKQQYWFNLLEIINCLRLQMEGKVVCLSDSINEKPVEYVIEYVL